MFTNLIFFKRKSIIIFLMPTVAEIVSIAKISQYLASNDVSKGVLYGARINPMLPKQLYIERKDRRAYIF